MRRIWVRRMNKVRTNFLTYEEYLFLFFISVWSIVTCGRAWSLSCVLLRRISLLVASWPSLSFTFPASRSLVSHSFSLASSSLTCNKRFFKYFLGRFFFAYYILHCFICRPSVPTDAGFEPRIVATGVLAVRRSNHKARSHPSVRNVKYSKVEVVTSGGCN